MAKDYFQDIVPPESGARPVEAPKKIVPPPVHEDTEGSVALSTPPDRGIRNVNIPSRPRPMTPDMRGIPPASFARKPRMGGGSRSWLWIIAGIAVVAILIVLLLFLFQKTTVTVTPQSQPVVFDRSAQFTAYPASTAASGTIPYTVQSTDLEDSEVVPSSGTEHAQTKATGTITVVNGYSGSPIKLIKNTRFQTSTGLIFRVPADISIPGGNASVPGKVQVTVAADQTGASYNVAPQSRLTIPGLRSNAAEYAVVYAYSTASTTGGFSGDRPAVAAGALDTALATVRARMQENATAFVKAQQTDSSFALTPVITFSDLPNTAEAGNSVRIHESAHVSVPVLPAAIFASAVAQTVAANATEGAVQIVPGADFTATINGSPSTSAPTGPLPFTLGGKALIVWKVDTAALAQALAGRDGGAFQTIVSNFPGVQTAHARIEPFWESKFPSNPASIHITVETLSAAK